MTREEAAKILDYLKGRWEIGPDTEAHEMGVSALRHLEQIENRLKGVLRELPMWKAYYNDHPEELLRYVLDGSEEGEKPLT